MLHLVDPAMAVFTLKDGHLQLPHPWISPVSLESYITSHSSKKMCSPTFTIFPPAIIPKPFIIFSSSPFKINTSVMKFFHSPDEINTPLGIPEINGQINDRAAKVPHFYFMEELKCNALSNSKQLLILTVINFLLVLGCHNIGVAMATPYGLVVPNIKKVQSQSIMEVTKELARLQQLAICNKLSTADITGGTITLSNIGSIGGKFGSPILNLPEAAIIAIGKIQKLPRFSDDDIVYPAYVTNLLQEAVKKPSQTKPRLMFYTRRNAMWFVTGLQLELINRIVDGATVARFCNEWKLLIEKPELLLLHMR
ncbi:hypothetical protein KFK09_002141 [Dendrobium nobile]|uniref:2-oxoacid dehydrogenase acyltransferase catalytic domain-containing protein n=1 Tax=Dendrobium nobile TaxID=94219 RepID=A0A8T3C9E5_DENNO|nr:hypothetical protein KFK09_002141 [Dendrobium nobile]